MDSHDDSARNYPEVLTVPYSPDIIMATEVMTMPRWSAEPEDGPPPDAPARDVLPEVYSMVPDPLWFMRLGERQQLAVLKHHCLEGGWDRVWAACARLVHRGGLNAPPNRLSPSQRSQQARRAAEFSHTRPGDPSERTAPARRAFLDGFEHQVDPDGKLDPVERSRLAAHAKKAYFAGLAMRSSKARRRHPQR